LFVVGFITVSVLGCATPRRFYDDAKVAMIQKDVTTEAQLLTWFGPASTRTLGPDGAKALSWRFSPEKGHATSSSGRLDVKLATDGKVIAYSGSAGSK
jgi:hypothetical protein